MCVEGGDYNYRWGIILFLLVLEINFFMWDVFFEIVMVLFIFILIFWFLNLDYFLVCDIEIFVNLLFLVVNLVLWVFFGENYI